MTDPYSRWNDDPPRRTLPPAQPLGWVDSPEYEPPIDDTEDPVPAWWGWESLRDRWDTAGKDPITHRQALIGAAVCGLVIALIVVLLAWPRTTKGEEPESGLGTVLIGGRATWYEDPRKTGFYAAAGPALRETLGDWRGRYVTVESGDRSVVVRLTDWCACGKRGGLPTLLDLSKTAFRALADPALGVIRVSIEIDGSPRPDPADDRMRDEVRDLPATTTGGPDHRLPDTSMEDAWTP